MVSSASLLYLCCSYCSTIYIVDDSFDVEVDDGLAADVKVVEGKKLQEYINCKLACEMACGGQENGIDYLGELIEAGQYSKYLLEVWVDWRLFAQQGVFGISTYSEIPETCMTMPGFWSQKST